MGVGYKSLSKKYEIKVSTIRNWCRQYQSFGIDGIRKTMQKTDFSGDFKLSVLRYRQQHELSYRETAQHFQIKNSATIANWNRVYREKGIAALSKPLGRPKKDGVSDMSKKPEKPEKPRQLSKNEWQELQELRVRNDYLEAEVLYLKKLDALIRRKNPSQTKKKPDL